MHYKEYLDSYNEYTVEDIITSEEKIDKYSCEKYVTFITKDKKYKTTEPDHILKFDKDDNQYYQLGYSYWFDNINNIQMGKTAFDYIFPIETDKKRAVKKLNKLIKDN